MEGLRLYAPEVIPLKFLKSLIPIGGYLSEDSEITIEELGGRR